MNYSKLATAIQTSNLTNKELQNLNELIILKLRSNRQIQEVIVKQQLAPGMAIMVDHPTHKDEVFTIKKVNRTKCVITDSKGRNLNCPLSMVIPM